MANEGDTTVKWHLEAAVGRRAGSRDEAVIREARLTTAGAHDAQNRRMECGSVGAASY
jgi:hypothetical protein